MGFWGEFAKGFVDGYTESTQQEIRPTIITLCVVRVVICVIIGFVTGMSVLGVVLFAIGTLILFEVIVRTVVRITDSYYEFGPFVVAIILHVLCVVVILIMHNLPLFRALFWDLHI